MTDFRRLSDTIFASPQIESGDVSEAKARGIALIINNRPDGEEEGQPTGAEIEQAASDAGIAYRAIPVSGGGFGQPQVTAMADAIAQADGPVLAYCRTGTRSTLLWSLAQASTGQDPDRIAGAASQAGYDIGPVRAAVDLLSNSASG